MKFVALALALLLAVGSHAASLQADAPASTLDHIRTTGRDAVVNVNRAVKSSLVHFDGTGLEGKKAMIEQFLDFIEHWILELQAKAAPNTDAFLAQIMEATAGFRAKIQADIEELRTAVGARKEQLWSTILNHIDSYQKRIVEIYSTHSPAVGALKDTVFPDMEAFRALVHTNVEETKNELMPIVTIITTKIYQILEAVKVELTPYMDEYKEQAGQAIQNVRETASGMSLDDVKGYVVSFIKDLCAKISE